MKAEIKFWVLCLGLVGFFTWATFFLQSHGPKGEDDDEAVPARSFVQNGQIVLSAASLQLSGIDIQPIPKVGNGYSVPRSAILNYHNQLFVFIEDTPDHFVRKEIEIISKSKGNEVQIVGIESKVSKVVTVGAGELLSEELKSTFQPVGD